MEFNEIANEFFKKQNVVVTLYPESITRNFEDLKTFYDFVEKEYEYWNTCTQGNVAEIRNHFYSAWTYLNNINVYSHDINQMNSNIVSAISVITKNNFPIIFSITSMGKLIKDRYEKNIQQANAICDYFFHKRVTSLSDLEYLKGIMYCFSMNDSELAITSEIDAERSVLLDLHERYSKELDVLHSNYIGKTDDINDTFGKWKQDTLGWKLDIEKKTQEFLDDKKTKLDELESLYKEKLLLAAPAEYWSKLSDSYRNTGHIWGVLSVVSSIVLIRFLTVILYKLPNSLTGTTSKLTFDNLRGTIIFALIVSVAVYIIRLFVRLALSSYHLSRDARERKQLTYVYLSLMNEKAIATEERNIVLQSIFSRADTGLLKGDSSPTIPDGVVSQIMKNIGK